MQRLHSVRPETAEGRTKELFSSVQQAYGMIPNAVTVMANSPAVLESYLSFSTAMGQTSLGEKLQNQVRLNTSENNACDYCSSILTAIAPSAGLSAADVLAGRTGNTEETKTKAAMAFAHDVLESRGKVSNEQLASIRDAGFDDAAIVEIVANVVHGCFTNFLNNVADTELDIPRVEPLEASATTESCST